jgi:pimeloyl-ACP methyl ester carboxylesterase
MPFGYVWRIVAAAAVLLGTLGVPAAARAEPREHRVALDNGRTTTDQLLGAIGRELGLPALPYPRAELDLTGLRGPAFCRQLDDVLWPACTSTIDGGALAVRLDRAKLPADAGTLRRAARLLAAGDATCPAGRYGLVLPERYDPARPLVVLIHGLDSDAAMWGTMVNLLQADGHQVAAFTYPNDGPVADAGHLLADGFADLRLKHPAAKPAMVVAHSMGGLVARHYVEGPAFRGGIDRVVMLGTPNHGSTWTGWRWAAEWHSQYKTCQREGNWTWSRLTDDGNGEAARDLQPGSEFPQDPERPPAAGRRAVHGGGRRPQRGPGGRGGLGRLHGRLVPRPDDAVVGLPPRPPELVTKSAELRQTSAGCDGPVTVESCKLPGVDDFVVVSADHTGLACGQPPAAWEVVRRGCGNPAAVTS